MEHHVNRSPLRPGSDERRHKELLLVAYFPVLTFWLLDAFFLQQEKLFRKLYDHVRDKNTGSLDFDMHTSAFKAQVGSLRDVALSKTLWPLHGGVFVVITVVYYRVLHARGTSLAHELSVMLSC